MQGVRWKLEDLPPRLREQVERRLGLSQTPRNAPSQASQGTDLKPPAPKQPDAPRPPRKRPVRAKGRMSHAEERFRDRFAPSMGWEVLMYEPCSIWISGAFRYTPDFLVRLPDGRLAFVEVKGSFRLQSQSRSRLAFADASTRTPGFAFLWAKEHKKHKTFSVEFWKAGKITQEKVR